MGLRNNTLKEILYGFGYSLGALTALVVLIVMILVAIKIVTVIFHFLF